MLEVAIMIEGQNGLTWTRWQKIVRLVEDPGFVGLFRSDHFTNSNPPDMESLELWTSLTWRGSHTKRIRHLILYIEATDERNNPLTQVSGPMIPKVGDSDYAGLPG